MGPLCIENIAGFWLQCKDWLHLQKIVSEIPNIAIVAILAISAILPIKAEKRYEAPSKTSN